MKLLLSAAHSAKYYIYEWYYITYVGVYFNYHPPHQTRSILRTVRARTSDWGGSTPVVLPFDNQAGLSMGTQSDRRLRLTTIQTYCPSAKLMQSVSLPAIGCAGYINIELANSGTSFHGTLASEPDMGCSIGEVGQSCGGTLGAFVKLTINGKASIGILTNHHVVRPASAPTKVLQKLNQYGYSPNNVLTTTHIYDIHL